MTITHLTPWAPLDPTPYPLNVTRASGDTSGDERDAPDMADMTLFGAPSPQSPQADAGPAPARPAGPPWPAARLSATPPPTAQAPQITHVPWMFAPSWGASTLNTPNTLAGMSYLFWWVSGLIVYFNERENRFVRFHAVQSILLTGALTVASVALAILDELSGDLAAATRQPAFAHLGQGLALLGYLAIIAIWLAFLVAAWSGHYLRAPIVGAYADRYAAPPREPLPPPFAG